MIFCAVQCLNIWGDHSLRGGTHREAPLICLFIVILSKISTDKTFLQLRLRGNALCEDGGRRHGSELSFISGSNGALLVGSGSEQSFRRA